MCVIAVIIAADHKPFLITLVLNRALQSTWYLTYIWNNNGMLYQTKITTCLKLYLKQAHSKIGLPTPTHSYFSWRYLILNHPRRASIFIIRRTLATDNILNDTVFLYGTLCPFGGERIWDFCMRSAFLVRIHTAYQKAVYNNNSPMVLCAWFTSTFMILLFWVFLFGSRHL